VTRNDQKCHVLHKKVTRTHPRGTVNTHSGACRVSNVIVDKASSDSDENN